MEILYCDFERGEDYSGNWTRLLSVSVYSSLHGLIYDQVCIPSKNMPYDYKNKNLSFERLSLQGKRFRRIQKELRSIFENKIVVVV